MLVGNFSERPSARKRIFTRKQPVNFLFSSEASKKNSEARSFS